MKIKILGLLMLASTSIFAQKKKVELTKPKLVVGIVVDQMRYDYLYRFYDKYSDNGLKRLMNDGFNCRNNHYHYASTVTGPGHAHIYTGSSPAISGIVGNEWHDKVENKDHYVVDDSTVNIVGDGRPNNGKMSPNNLKVTTITDQLRIASQFNSKVIGVAIKDRGSILPAGHTGMAYWYDAYSGNWITSDFYQKELPTWVTKFNAQKLPETYIAKGWETLRPIESYVETEADDQPYEATISGEPKAVFPHKITMASIASSYYGNELTKKFALAAFDAENLGRGAYTDFLAVSFSTPDYVGHAFGPQSKEIEDVYIRFDLDIAEILNHLDATLGKGTYSVFLSADHGVAEIPSFLRKHNINSGLFTGSDMQKKAEAALVAKFGEGKYIDASDNYQLYLNHKTLKSKKLTTTDALEAVKEVLEKEEGIYTVVDISKGDFGSIPTYYKEKLNTIYNPKRSGELMVLVEPAWFSGYTKGTTHGSMYAYDTHVPLLLYGWGIKKGETTKSTYISDIAPTIAQLLNILEPNGNIGKPVSEALKKSKK